MQKVELYGADWCPKTSLISNHLQAEWIDFDYYNVEKDDQAADRVRSQYEGKLKFPALSVDGKFYLNPKVAQLREILKDPS